ncbi:MAG: DNA-binding response regulator [Calditrichaeota bacterium]|nr:MAG: DNA-binding response regulator [Calditrichota bacterium]
MKYKILLAEDDPNLGYITKEFLSSRDFDVTLAENGTRALDLFRKNFFDLCILDVMMPKMDGFTLAEEIRKLNENIPIIFLTVRSMKDDVIKGLKLGADDYIRKPFHMEELLLRINNILKRIGVANLKGDHYEIGEYTFYPDRQILKFKNEEYKLSGKENDLLLMLCRYKNQLIERSFILNKVWQNDDYFAGRSMDVYITKLRKLLKNDPNVEIINIHGKGFKLIA